MSQILIQNHTAMLPYLHLQGAVGLNGITLNATGETVQHIGEIILENPSSSAKTISAAGGGSLIWLSGAVTFADAGSTFKVGMQDLSTVSNPGQGDGAFDVYASFTGGGGGITANAVQSSIMTSGTKTISNGQKVAIVYEFTARAGADSVLVQSSSKYQVYGATYFPGVVENTGGSYAYNAVCPVGYILFDDGSKGWIYGSDQNKSSGNISFAVDSAPADEYCNIINYPIGFFATSIRTLLTMGAYASDYEAIIYSDALSAPIAQRTITHDSTYNLQLSSSKWVDLMLSTPFMIQPNVNYAVSIKPTTTNALNVYYVDRLIDFGLGLESYAARRLNNSGAFSDYNGGTAKTRQMMICLVGTHMPQDSHFAHSQIGI